MGLCHSLPTHAELLATADANAPQFEKRGGTMLARKVSVYDGDTFTILMIAEDRNPYRRRCRCIGYDSPEMRGRDARKSEAIAARDHLESVIPSGVFSLTYTGLDKYGRLLVTFDVNGEPLKDHMIRLGHGYAYDGGTKTKDWT